MSLLNSAVSGIVSAQRALAVTSHNIANVNTPGYNRQVAVLVTRQPQFVGNGFLGSGVQINDIQRVHNEFLTIQVRSSISAEQEISSFLELAQRIDNMLADETIGLGPALENFFKSVQEVTNLPSSITNRQVMLSEAESLAAKFQFLDARIKDITTDIRSRFDGNIKEINTIAKAIGDLNNRITFASGQATGQLPNDLLDQRDLLIEELSQFVAVTTNEQQDGALNVFIGSGQPLVLGPTASSLGFTETFNGHFEITLSDAFNTSTITNTISGGSLGGILDFQTQMLEPVQNSLGRLAIGFADSFNDQHRLGRNLDGDVNLAFFNVAGTDVIPLGGALDNVTADITDPTALTTSDYRLVYNGSNNYTLTRLSDGQTTAIATGGVFPFTSAVIDGFTIDIAAVAGAVGHEYIIRPTINGASDIRVIQTDPRKIAAAGPLRSSEATNSSGLPTNTGNAQITPVEINSITGIPLGATITLTFDSAGNQFNISAPPGGTLAYNPGTESAGKQFTIATAGNATFTISGVPANGDEFVIENNTNADGDNRNALNLSALQSSAILLGGTASYQDSYGQLIADVGTSTRQAEISTEALGTLRQQSTEAREGVSGVNLEEEAGNMLKFQQAFQAAAQLVGLSDVLFQSLLGAVQ